MQFGMRIGALAATCFAATLAGCGGGGSAVSSPPEQAVAQAAPRVPPEAALSARDANRLADQASFGATEGLVANIRAQGAAAWIASQMTLSSSRYQIGGDAGVHQVSAPTAYCLLPAHQSPTCWRDNLSTQPLLWDFYRNAVGQPDQLRQRMAFALQQIVVVSGVEVTGTYGFRNYHNNLLDNAFGNYRQVLTKVALSPVMGDFLNNANNDKAAPNENFARELLQLFSIGTCDLNIDGTLKGGKCSPTYDNDTVRAYAYALTGWTYPAGGTTAWGCWPVGANCRFYGADMAPFASYHDSAGRKLLSGVALAAGHSSEVALERVLDSLMAHPNIAPFVGKRLIQHLVASNPSAAYVGRVAAAFASGSYSGGGRRFGSGKAGDLAASVAAVLLDSEARSAGARNAGKLREPVLMFTGVLRALNGKTDGDVFSWWGEGLRQHAFRPPSVFNYYPPDYPVPGTTLTGPAFGVHNASAALERLNYLAWLIDWGGGAADPSVPGAVGTQTDLSAFVGTAADAAALVDRIAVLALGQPLAGAPRDEVIKAVALWTPAIDKDNWQVNRVKTAAYLVFGSPNYQMQR